MTDNKDKDLRDTIKNDKIYKFYPYRDFDLDALAGSYLWFSSIEDFNDPFEGMYLEQIAFRGVDDINDEEIIEINEALHEWAGYSSKAASSKALAIYNNIMKTEEDKIAYKQVLMENIESQLRATFTLEAKKRCCCFITDYENKPAITSKLMWSHYSNGLRGFMLEFDTEALLKSLEDCNQTAVQYGKVNYSNFERLDALKDLSLSPTAKGNFSRILLRKSPEWVYEQEFRLISEMDRVYFNPNVIRSIVVGEKIPHPKLKTLLAVIKSQGLLEQVKVAQINKKTLELDIVDLNISNLSPT
ncbi:DUF2971 domain-containing protein [Pseudoalteromonas sp. T1lg88]|uniref:DUF2971 domain-containing protein n=1 Tax=Pseudoalteromonas sp. T1lg88 TaxID=2077104 RepID=UPI000CF68158|nr:DUF2971 domain-containing protein [Pseudoalteromonas sp. T1lg88]